MKKIVLDTNVLLDNPDILLQDSDNEIHIHFQILKELDKFKSYPGFRGFNARTVSRILDEATKGNGNYMLPGGADLRLAYEGVKDTVDETIVEYAYCLCDSDVVVVSNDINVRLMARIKGVSAEPSEIIDRNTEDIFSGCKTLFVPGQVIDDAFNGKIVEVDVLSEIVINEFAVLRSESNPSKSALIRKTSDTSFSLIPNRFGNLSAFGILPRSKEQSFAFDLLFDDSVSLVSLVGKAGTGKTLCALAAALSQTDSNFLGRAGRYRKVLILKPICPVGKEIGYLPGTIEEKLLPWLSPIEDNLLSLVEQTSLDMMMDDGTIEIEAMSHIRGRSIRNAFIIVDEAQNMSKHEIKTVLTRVGEGSKVVLTGDVEQIDNRSLTISDNALTYAIESFRGQSLAGYVTLLKGERSDLAELAAKLL